ncbi:secretion activator protein [Collimonas arenae]|uniref:Secretion activator protein n=1 Tax=Collimonas arenae TaxID=279058 RepID=A0A0A1FH76_9BURK|nr:glycosyl hydrolase 108 family protein [Collimonas arenae]AIY43030.1 secretion activator protein [Collimonas arenae]
MRKESPFAWPGFEIIDATAVTPKDAFQRQQVQNDRLLPGDKEQFKPSADVVNNSALMLALDKAMDRNHDGKLDVNELKSALAVPEIAQGVTRIIGRYQSEWGGDMTRWTALTPLMKNGEGVWTKELERIQKLQWWPQVSTVKSLPSPTVLHFHPIGFIGNFNVGESDCKARFLKISSIILIHEGGYVNDPKDSGGATNKGIAWNAWQAYAKEDLGVEPTLENLIALTNDQACKIYLNRYWEPKGFCKIRNEKTALMIYDWSITSGQAIKKIQELLNLDFGKNIVDNNHMTDETIDAVNSIEDQDNLIEKIGKTRKKYYESLAYQADGKPGKNIKFLNGWLNRVDDCLNYHGR